MEKGHFLFLAELLRAGGGSLVGCRAERTTKHPFPQSVTYSVFWSIQCEKGPEPHFGPPIPGADWKPGVIDRKAEKDSAGARFRFLCTSPAPQKPIEAIAGTHACTGRVFFALEGRQIHSQCVVTQSI